MTEYKRRQTSTAWMGLAGIGIEFVAAVAGLALLGWWLDRKYDWTPICLLIGTGLGLIGGSYNMIRQSLAAAKRAEQNDRNQPTEGERNNHP